MVFFVERLRGIEPLSIPWQGIVLPLYDSRIVATCSGLSELSKDNFSDPLQLLLFPKNPFEIAWLDFWEPYFLKISGASGQNRTDYASLFRAALYQ